MDSLMVCGVCAADWPPGAVFCPTCGTSVAQVEPRSFEEVPGDAHDEGQDGHLDAPASCERCGATNPRGSQRCLTCFAPIGGQMAPGRTVTLQFPWGARRIHDGERMLLGRAHESDVATELQAFPDVSRRHAEVWVRDGALVVRDLGSTNGTFRNGDRLRPQVDEVLGPGDRLRLGDDLVVGVGAEG